MASWVWAVGETAGGARAGLVREGHQTRGSHPFRRGAPLALSPTRAPLCVLPPGPGGRPAVLERPPCAAGAKDPQANEEGGFLVCPALTGLPRAAFSLQPHSLTTTHRPLHHRPDRSEGRPPWLSPALRSGDVREMPAWGHGEHDAGEGGRPGSAGAEAGAVHGAVRGVAGIAWARSRRQAATWRLAAATACGASPGGIVQLRPSAGRRGLWPRPRARGTTLRHLGTRCRRGAGSEGKDTA